MCRLRVGNLYILHQSHCGVQVIQQHDIHACDVVGRDKATTALRIQITDPSNATIQRNCLP